MASYTPNINLIKPAINDPFNVEDANSNMQKIDDAYGKVIILTGTVAPTTSTIGTVGQYYLNTTTSILYQCVNINGSVYTWRAFDLSSLSGILPISKGGTGATSAASAITNLGAAQIVKGSYMGTGTYGASNPSSLVLPFAPKLIFIMCFTDVAICFTSKLTADYAQYGYQLLTRTSSGEYAKLSADGKTVYWYSTANAACQLNQGGGYPTYYVAIG